jgi:DNA repair exonuclease SbcCD nuclease subunit
MKCLILGDVHLGRSISLGKPGELGGLNSRIQDQVDLLDWAYNLCVQDAELKTIIITGDVYQDFRPHPAVISLFMRWLKKCERLGVGIHIVMGNHDILRSGQYVVSALDLVSELELDNATVHKNIDYLELDDYIIVFFPFRDKRMYEAKTNQEALKKLSDEFKSVLPETSKIKVAVGHLAIEGSLSIGDEVSDLLNEMFVPPEIFEWFDYVWMGHIHNPQVIQHHNPYLAHIGSLDRSDFHKAEVDNEKIAILLDPKAENKFSELILPTRPLRPVKIDVPTGKDSTEFVINELCFLSKKLPFKGSITRIDIQLNSPDLESVNREKVEAYLKDKLEVQHICGFSESRTISTIQIDPEDSFDNTMEVAQTINKWAETREHFENNQERDEFKAAAHEIRQAYEDKYLK